MIKQKLGTLFLVKYLILTIIVATLGGPSAPIVYVAGDGSRDF